MTKRYTGGVISSSLPTVNAAGASGVFLLSQQADYQSRNSWPPFKVEESLRFRGAASAKLSRTVTTSSASTKGTFSAWIKRGKDYDSNNNGALVAAADNYYYGQFYQQTVYFGDTTYYLNTAAVFRDPAAWYHVVFVIDTTQATSSNRMQIWVNGIRQTSGSFAVYPTLNYTFPFLNNVQAWYIGGRASDGFFDGYMSEVYFVDGLALTPSSFGATDKDGNWSPIAYTGTYGTNGFYLNFRDNTSATTMGYDYSGNGNNWTLNGFNVSTANTTYDIMIDVPEDQDSANVRGNYATLNPLDYLNTNTGSLTLTNGNLLVTRSTTAYGGFPATMALPSSGKFAFEFTASQAFNGSTNEAYFGIGVQSNGTFTNSSATGYVSDYYTAVNITGGTGAVYKKFSGGSSTSHYAGTGAVSSGDVFQFLVDMTNGTVDIKKNGSAYGSQVTGLPNTLGLYPYISLYGSVSMSANFGQSPFASAPTSGYKALNTYNLPEPTIKQPNKYFNATIYSGDSTSNRVITTNGGSDFVWIKRRDSSTSHILFDAIRGAGKTLYSHLTSAEVDNGGYYVQTFGTTSFTLGTGGDAADNITGGTYVGWSWNAGGSTVTNTSGSISAQVRANPIAGFSIVTYTGTGVTGTIGHGLGVAPAMIIVKSRSNASNWYSYHQSIGNTGAVALNLTNATITSANFWNNTSPTSSVFTASAGSAEINGNGLTYVAYCFAQVAGYSAFGSYTGNGSTDGPFVYTGFRPRFVMTKRTDSSSGGNWTIIDGARNPYNVTNLRMYADTNDADGAGNIVHDFVSNGFKVRQGDSSTNNISGGTYIYMAFAETPFKYARSR